VSEQVGDSLNVEQIMEQIRERVRLRKEAGTESAMNGNGSADSLSLPAERPALLSLYDVTMLNHNVVAAEMLSNQVGKLNPRNPGLYNDLIQLGKKSIRRMLGWYTRSLQQFNGAVTRSLKEMARALENLYSNVTNLANSQDNLVEHINRLADRINRLADWQNSIAGRIDELAISRANLSDRLSYSEASQKAFFEAINENFKRLEEAVRMGRSAPAQASNGSGQKQVGEVLTEAFSSAIDQHRNTGRTMSKTITIDGRDLIVYGPSGDAYFDNLNIDHTNDFLVHISKHHLLEDATIFDVGANIGVTAALLATASPRGRLFAFEPGARTYPYLLATIEANKLANCHTEQIGLGTSSGEVDFLSDARSGAFSHMALDGVSLGGSNGRVKIKTVDEVVSELKLTRLDLIKIDVEGFELDVLQGAQSTLARLMPQVFLEFNVFTLIAYGGQNPRHVLERLKRTFPHVYCFDGGVLHEITNEASVLAFIHKNLIERRCLEDLFCTFKAIPLALG
jgi:FkbM family methyltransferase